MTAERRSENGSIARRAVVKKAVVKKMAARATMASAKLENREVPAGYVRSALVTRFLAERQSSKH